MFRKLDEYLNALVDPVFSVDYTYSFLQFKCYWSPVLSNYGINLICWKSSLAFKEEKNQKLKTGLGSETGQIRGTGKPSCTEEEKTSYFLFQVIYYPS